MSVKKSAFAGTSAAVIAATVAFTPNWEGYDLVAKRDKIGTGHPITYCIGQTDEFGKVKVGERFTKEQCDALLAKSMPKYLDKIGPCVTVPVPVKVMASLTDAAYNGGPARICRSPMVKQINAGNIRAGCDAFNGWLVNSDGQFRSGLDRRRSGELRGDKRKSERALCLEGLSEPKNGWYVYAPPSKEPPPPPRSFWQRVSSWIFR